MKRLVIDDFAEIAAIMYEKIITGSCDNVAFIGYYEDAMCVIKELMMYMEVLPYSIQLQPARINGYSNEYCVCLNTEFDLFCEEIYNVKDKCYVSVATDFALISDDCNSALLHNIKCDKDNRYEISYNFGYDEDFEEDDMFGVPECDGNCAACGIFEDGKTSPELNKTENKFTEKNLNQDKHEIFTCLVTDDIGNLKGFEKLWEVKDGNTNYKVTYDCFSDDEDMLKDILKDFNIKFF